MVLVGVARQTPRCGYKLPTSNLLLSNIPTGNLPASNLPNGNIQALHKTIRIDTDKSLYGARSPSTHLTW